MTIALGALAFVALALEVTRLRVPGLNRLYLRTLSPLLKREEDRRITGATYLLIAAFLVFAFLDRDVAVACLLFLSLGDPAAALVGQRVPGPRIFGKSPGGTVAFIGVSLAVTGILVGSGVASYHWALAAGAAIAGLVELAPLPVDDNLTIPLLSGAFMHLAMG